jgi:phospholipid/cholesterol/gamma-HCH transport system substrate-binding protein
MSALSRLRRSGRVPVSELQKRANPVRFGIVFVIVLAIAVYFAFTKHLPFKHGYRLNAQFNSVVNIAPKSPVRIAGVTIGKVTGIRREGDGGLVSMEIEGRGLPIHQDATLKIRPRIFLEGNFFVELQPGTPGARTLSSGATIPVTQTADPVQLDQVLDALNTDTRANLQTFLAEYGAALTAKPTAAENAEQSPEVRGLNAAQALNKAYQVGPEALRDAAILNQALAGQEPHDLSKLFASIERVTAALDVHEQQLGELIGNFNTFLGAFAAQSPSLRIAVAQLPSALRNATHGFDELAAVAPPLREFALNLTPGVEALPATLTAAFPWITQTEATLAPNALGGVASTLGKAAPAFAKLIDAQPEFFHQINLFNKCLSNVIFPAGAAKLQDGPNTSGAENYKEFWYAMVGLASLGQNFSGNGTGDRFLGGGAGTPIVSQPVQLTGELHPTGNAHERLVSQTPFAPEGTRPRFPGVEPPYRPLVACYKQKLPEFNGPLAQGPADGSGG